MVSTFTLSPASKSVLENDGSVSFTLTRSSSSGTETVYVSTIRTEGATNSSDYSGLNEVAFTFTSGQTSKTVTINITNDSTVETNETFGLIVQAAQGQSSGTYLDKSTFTITNDDSAAASTFTLSPDTASVAENAGSVSFTVTHSSNTGSETVYVSTTKTEGYSNSGDYTGIDTQAFTFTMRAQIGSGTISCVFGRLPASIPN